MASHLLKYAVLGTSLQLPMSELEVLEAVTSSYPPWVQKLFVTSNIKTIQDALSVLNKLEAIEGQHHSPQQWSNQNRPHARSSYGREDHGDGRTHAVRQTYVSQEQKDAREIQGTVSRKVMTYKRHTGGQEVTEGITPPVVI